jgi:hypothetical protein
MSTPTDYIQRLHEWLFKKCRYYKQNAPTKEEFAALINEAIGSDTNLLTVPTVNTTLFLKWDWNTKKVVNLTKEDFISALSLTVDPRVTSGDSTHFMLYWNDGTKVFDVKTLAEIRTALNVCQIVAGGSAFDIPMWDTEHSQYYPLNISEVIPFPFLTLYCDGIEGQDGVALKPCMFAETSLKRIGILFSSSAVSVFYAALYDGTNLIGTALDVTLFQGTDKLFASAFIDEGGLHIVIEKVDQEGTATTIKEWDTGLALGQFTLRIDYKMVKS